MTEPGIYCRRAGCPAHFPAEPWAWTGAVAAGWHVSGGGRESFCPDHLPTWVPAWRARRALQADMRRHPGQLPLLPRTDWEPTP
jgi:hypothetical protein